MQFLQILQSEFHSWTQTAVHRYELPEGDKPWPWWMPSLVPQSFRQLNDQSTDRGAKEYIIIRFSHICWTLFNEDTQIDIWNWNSCLNVLTKHLREIFSGFTFRNTPYVVLSNFFSMFREDLPYIKTVDRFLCFFFFKVWLHIEVEID